MLDSPVDGPADTANAGGGENRSDGDGGDEGTQDQEEINEDEDDEGAVDATTPLTQGGERTNRDSVVDLGPMRKAEYGDEYTVTLTAKPARFHFVDNYVFWVFKNGPAHEAGMQADSRILRVNETEIRPDSDHFRSVLEATECPMTLTLQLRKTAPGSSLDEGSERKTLTTADKLKLIMVYMSVAIDVFGNVTALPVMPFLAAELGLKDSQLGILTGAFQLAAIPGGFLTLKIAIWKGTKYAFLYSVIGSGVTLILQGLAWDFWSLLIFRVCAGLTGNSVPVALTHIASVVPTVSKAKWMSYVGACVTTSLVVAPAFGGSLMNYGLRVPFFVGGAIALLGFFAVLFFLNNLHIPKPNKESGRLKGVNFACLVLAFLKPLPFTAMISMVGNYCLKYFALSGQDVGLVLSVQGVWSTLSTLFLYPLLTKWLGLDTVLIFGFFCMTIGFIGAAFMERWYLFLVFMVPLVGGGYGFATSMSPLADSFATASSRPKVHSYSAMLDSLGFSIGAVTWGFVFQFGFQNNFENLIWICASAVSLVVCIVALAMKLGVFVPAFKRVADQKRQADVALAKSNETKLLTKKTDIAPASEADYLRLGTIMGEKFRLKGIDWVKHFPYIMNSLEMLIPDLPDDTLQHRMRVVEKWAYVSKHAQQTYREEPDDVSDALKRLHVLHSRLQ